LKQEEEHCIIKLQVETEKKLYCGYHRIRLRGAGLLPFDSGPLLAATLGGTTARAPRLLERPRHAWWLAPRTALHLLLRQGQRGNWARSRHVIASKEGVENPRTRLQMLLFQDIDARTRPVQIVLATDSSRTGSLLHVRSSR
jgi:hypothetical protein